jgi:hypothetical protein
VEALHQASFFVGLVCGVLITFAVIAACIGGGD